MKNLLIIAVAMVFYSCVEIGGHIPEIDYPDVSQGQDAENFGDVPTSLEVNGQGGVVEPEPPPMYGIKESPPGRGGSVMLPSWSDRHPRPRMEDDEFVVTFGTDTSDGGGVNVADTVDASDGEDSGDDVDGGEEVFEPPPPDCNDDNPCTDDSFEPESGCVHLDAVCDDGDSCTIDTCDPATGDCLSLEFPCGDTNPCTTDSCVDGTCRHQPAVGPCDDGSFCTTGDICVGDACKGTAVVCDDGNPCTGDYCSYTSGCVHTPTTEPCNDGDPCTTDDHCDGGLCVSTPGVCEDGNPCTDDVCELEIGCAYAPINCDDDDPCTVDVCDPTNGCMSTHSDELCEPPSCDDGNPCTVDAYDPATGCMYTQKAQHPWMPLCKPCSVNSDCEPIYGLESLSGQCIGGTCAYQAQPGFGWVCKSALVADKQAWLLAGNGDTATATSSPLVGEVPADTSSFKLLLEGQSSCFDPNSFCLCKQAEGWVFAGTFAGGFGAAPCPEVSSMGCTAP